MTDRKVNLLLFLTILATILLPLVAAFYFLDDALQTSLDLGFNRDVVQALDSAADNLKTLRGLDAQNQESYRRQFAEVENLQQIYKQPQLIKDSILGSLTIYFGAGLLAAVLLSLLLAFALSKRIARSYKAAFDELLAQRERVRYLEEMSSWQTMAKMLAHEIKNPLTPIEVLVTSLSKSYRARTPQEFQEQLRQTEAMIVEELGHLKNTVSKFSEFAKLPSVQLQEENLVEVLTQHAKTLAGAFDSATIHIESTELVRANLDVTLFRQVLANIVRNGVEANPGRKVHFRIRVTEEETVNRICIANDGAPVPADLAARIFDPYISDKHGKDNMGLGLAIARKIVLEHGGEITYAEQAGHPTFTIALLRVD